MLHGPKVPPVIFYTLRFPFRCWKSTFPLNLSPDEESFSFQSGSTRKYKPSSDENIKSDILQNKTQQYLQNKATAHIKSFINFFKQINIKRHIMLGSLYGFGPLMARYAIWFNQVLFGPFSPVWSKIPFLAFSKEKFPSLCPLRGVTLLRDQIFKVVIEPIPNQMNNNRCWWLWRQS